jgi:DNA invertase Pin-like site-specific DNA recombinase
MTKAEQRSLAFGSQSKIRAEHLQRLAYIYIRQSSAKQVEQHRESQFNQRQLVERAEALGWHRDRIRVIDADQGLPGKGSDYRQGFQELVAELSLGQVGIVFGFDASRLARNNRDWYHLLDLAAMFGTLIGDCDGIYDPRLYNDRLLLGLKGTMSEAELHLLHERLDGGRMSQVMRGEYRQALPTGLVRLPDHSVVKDPDDQVRHAIELVLAKFDELGSCGKVMRYLENKRSYGGRLKFDADSTAC